MTRVLVIEDDPLIRENVEELLDAEGFEVETVAEGAAGVAAALARVPDVVVCDIMMPGMNGHSVLRALRERDRTAAVPFIFLTARAERDEVRAGMRLGADDYLVKPFRLGDLLDAIRARLARRETLASGPRASRPPPTDEDAVVESDALKKVWDEAARAADSLLSVLLLGETGVGKDVLARFIHAASSRRDRPLVPLNCAALAETLLESELFGHERGAFTGAVCAKPGLFEAAEGGTVFLDEVGDLPAATQAKLLRVLEDRRVLRVGARAFRDVDVRFVAATNRDLAADAEAGRFRRDLYYRIAGITLTVPPLRDRRADIAPLARRFARRASDAVGRARPVRLSDDAIAELRAHDWPGNVRELRNAVERAVTMTSADVVTAVDLPEALVRTSSAEARVEDLERELRAAEKQRVVDALERCGGNQTRAAKELGISRRTLLHRLDEFDLPRPRKRD